MIENGIVLAVTSYYDAQQVRIALSNRIADLVREKHFTQEEADRRFAPAFEFMKKAEAVFAKDIKHESKEHRIYAWLISIRGIGPVLAGGLLALIGDIARFDTVSKLWAYAGLHVIDGKAPKLERGKRANWNSTLRTLCWKLGESFVKAGKGEEWEGQYRALYDSYKARDRAKHPEKVDSGRKSRKGKVIWMYTDGHIHARAKRYAVKILLSHLWEYWRKFEGLPVREPYAIEQLGHTGKIEPKHRKKEPSKKGSSKS